MLKILRNKSHQKKIYLVIAIAVISTFTLGGIHFYNKDEDTSSALGHIDNKPVSVQDYLKSYKATQHQVELFYGEKAREFSRFINLKGQAWDRLLLLNYAKKEGIKTSDAEVVGWIGTQFSLNGKFDELLYKRYVETALRSNPREFEEEVRGSLTLSKISERLNARVSLTEEELKKSYDEEHKDAGAGKFDEEKENFRKTLLSRKRDEAMQKLLTDLRGKLKLDLEMVNKLFPPEE